MHFLAKKTTMIGGGLALAVATMGCGAFETKDNGKKAEQIDTGLAGEWSAVCSPGNFLGLTRTTEVYTFSAVGDFDYSATVFTDDHCQEPAVALTEHGTVDALGKSSVANAKDVNFTITKADVTPKSAKAVKLLNAASYCGISDWVVGKAVSITDKDCLGERLNKGETVADVYQISGNELRLGGAMGWFDGNDASNRPSELDMDKVYVKK